MTKQEAIRILEQSCPKRPQKLWSIKRKEAVKMAIEALNFMDEYHQSNMEAYAHDMGVSLEQAERELRVEELSCSENPNRSDTIYRQDAIDVAKQHWYKPDIAKALEELPSAHPEDDEWCHDCKEYDQEKHCCPRFNHLIRKTVEEVRENAQEERKKGRWIIDKDCEGKSRYVTCNRCGHKEFNWNNPNYCENCGAEMEGEDK